MTTQTNHPIYKLGLALSGGGAKGFAHIGVFKLLLEGQQALPPLFAEGEVAAAAGVAPLEVALRQAVADEEKTVCKHEIPAFLL